MRAGFTLIAVFSEKKGRINPWVLAVFVENGQFFGKKRVFRKKIEWKPAVPVKIRHEKR